MARGGILGVGIVLLIIALIGYITPVNNAGNTAFQMNVLCNTDLFQFGQLFHAETSQLCSKANLMVIGTYASGILGIILIVVGSVVPSRGVKSLTCPFCNYSASSANELHNHSLNCEKRNKETPKKKNEALDILKERYARGEITKEEFDNMKNDLS